MNGLLYWSMCSLIIGLPMALVYRRAALSRIHAGKEPDTKWRRGVIRYTMAITIIVWPWAVIAAVWGIVEAIRFRAADSTHPAAEQ